MRKSQIAWAALFVMASAFLAAPVWAAVDGRVKGSWLEIPAIYMEDPDIADKIEGWFADMEIVERAAAKPGKTVRQRLPERVVPKIIPSLYRLCKL